MAQASKETDEHIKEFLLGVYEPCASADHFIGLQDIIDEVIILCEVCGFTGYNQFALAKRPGRIRSLIIQLYEVENPGNSYGIAFCIPLLTLDEIGNRLEAFNRKWKLKMLLS